MSPDFNLTEMLWWQLCTNRCLQTSMNWNNIVKKSRANSLRNDFGVSGDFHSPSDFSGARCLRCHNESLMIYNKRAEYYTVAVFQEPYIEIYIKAIYSALYLILIVSKNFFWPAWWLKVCSCFSAPFLPCFYGSMNLSPLVYCDFIQQLWCLQVLKAINHHQPDVQCTQTGR